MKVLETYRVLGFPGCVGSMDVTHVPLGRCPDKYRFLCSGKEGYPTLAFQVVVDHFRRVHHVSVAFFGAANDKSITKNDAYPIAIGKGLHEDVEFVLYDENGVPTLCNGAYLIVDNGYQKWSFLIPPSKSSNNRDEILWSEWLESIRKDVECFFGVLKARFRLLRNNRLTRYHG